jgi:hypothetical protein
MKQTSRASEIVAQGQPQAEQQGDFGGDSGDEPGFALPTPTTNSLASLGEGSLGQISGGLGKTVSDITKLPAKDLLALLDRLPPSVLAQARSAIGGTPSGSGEAETLPDGSVRVTVTFDPDLGQQLKLWAEAQNEPLAKFLVAAMTSYVQMDWQAVQAT